MKEEQEVKVEAVEKRVVSAKCDWCGSTFDKLTTDCGGYGQIEISFGYASRFDGALFEGEICDDCFEKHFKKKLRQARDPR